MSSRPALITSTIGLVGSIQIFRTTLGARWRVFVSALELPHDRAARRALFQIEVWNNPAYAKVVTHYGDAFVTDSWTVNKRVTSILASASRTTTASFLTAVVIRQRSRRFGVPQVLGQATVQHLEFLCASSARGVGLVR